VEKRELLNTVYEGVNCETLALLESGISVLKMLMKHMIFLIGWLGILMNLKLVALILVPHPFASLIMPLLYAKFAIVLITPVILVPIIMKALLDLAI